MKKLSLMKSKKYATYAKKSFALLTMRKMNLNYTIKSEIIVGKFRGAAHNICYLRCNVPKEIPIMAHSATYNHHFIIKQLAK